MAAILENVFDEKIACDDLILWLSKSSNLDAVPDCLRELSQLRQDFVPFFLNYLRDQSLPLLQASKTANQSPAKTPYNVKNKIDTKIESGTRRTSSKPVQLFSSSPFESPKTRENVVDCNVSRKSSPNSSIDSPSLPDNEGKENRKSNYRSSHFHYSPNDRPKYKQTLGDFLTSTPETDQRKKKSQRGLKCGESPSPRSYGRHQSSGKPAPSADLQRGMVNFQQSGINSKSSPPIFSLNSAEDFPPVGLSTPQVKKDPLLRRITPTLVSSKTSGSSRQRITLLGTPVWSKEVNPLFSSQEQERSESNLDFERQLLRKEREKVKAIDQTQSPIQHLLVTPTKTILERTVSVTDYITAEREEVIHEGKLDMLAQIHSGLLDACFISNLTVELYFVIQLLTLQGPVDNFPLTCAAGGVIEYNYFSSIHNGVFYAVSVLQRQSRLLCLLEKGTLRLLAENQRISSFSPSLRDILADAYSASSIKVNPVCNVSSPIGGISFQEDTDNKQNFPSERCFHVFKKQRDIFYELIREWQDKHLVPDWKMVDEFKNRIQSLVNSRMELANHVHFVRLFQSQLLEMCKCDSTVHLDVGEDGIALLSHLKRSNPEKFKRLQERFITPYKVRGPSPNPSFTGCQEFFRDFILVAESHTFNHHLTDSITIQLLELNDVNFEVLDTDSNDIEINWETKELFANRLMTIRLLGKFLGFVTFLPYQTPDYLPNSLGSAYLEYRNKIQSHRGVDLYQCLQKAVRSGRCVMTVSWVVEYMSMIDRMGPSISYYKSVIALLIEIYHMAYKRFIHKRHGLNMFYLLVLLGWFLENPSLPHGVFFMTEVECNILHSSGITLDNIDLLTPQLLYNCCPYLGEVRSLLVEFSIGLSHKNSQIRKITPVSADQSSCFTIVEKHIQVQLEENFFHNHPASMKRCVDFVADRVASNYIKIFRSTTLSSLLNEAKAIGKKLSFNTVDSKHGGYNEDAVKLANKAKSRGISEVANYTDERVSTILGMVLPEETSAEVMSIAVQVCQRVARDKVNSWMKSHMTPNIFNKEIISQLKKNIAVNEVQTVSMAGSTELKTIVDVEVTGTFTPHLFDHVQDDLNERNCKSSVTVLLELKETLQILRGSKGKREVCGGIGQLLRDIKITLTSQEDVILSMSKTMANLLGLLAETLVIFFPHLLNKEIVDQLMELWKCKLHQYFNPGIFFSNKFLYLLMNQSTKKEDSRDAFYVFLNGMLQHRILSLVDVCHLIKEMSSVPPDSAYNPDITFISPLLIHMLHHLTSSPSDVNKFSLDMEQITTEEQRDTCRYCNVSAFKLPGNEQYIDSISNCESRTKMVEQKPKNDTVNFEQLEKNNNENSLVL